jgi:hypothetical protein
MIAVEADLTGTTHVLRDVAYEFSIKVEVAEAQVFAIANQQQRLIVTCIHSQPMAAVALSVLATLSREA